MIVCSGVRTSCPMVARYAERARLSAVACTTWSRRTFTSSCSARALASSPAGPSRFADCNMSGTGGGATGGGVADGADAGTGAGAGVRPIRWALTQPAAASRNGNDSTTHTTTLRCCSSTSPPRTGTPAAVASATRASATTTHPPANPTSAARALPLIRPPWHTMPPMHEAPKQRQQPDGVLVPGQLVGAYQVDAVAGEGANAYVYLVRHRTRTSPHALKVLRNTDSRKRMRIEREAVFRDDLRHPNIVPAIEAIDVNGRPGLVMDFV